MKKIAPLFSLVIVAIFFTACSTPPSGNATNAAANTNAAKSAAAAPTKEALVALENKAIQAWISKDTKFGEGFLTDNFVSFDEHGKVAGKAEVLKMMSDNECEFGKFTISDEKMTPAGPDVAALTYRIAADIKCDGKPMPAEMWVASIYVRSGDQWKGSYHNEIPVAREAEDKGEKAEKDDKAAKPEKSEKAPPPPLASDDAKAPAKPAPNERA